MAFDQSTRNRLQKFVSESRDILTEEFTRQMQATFGMDPKSGTIAEMDTLSFLDNQGRQTASILRETLAHYVASISGKSGNERNKQALDRIIREQAFTVLNRLGALRMAEARGFLLESIAKGYSSKGFQLYKNLAGTALGETGDAYSQFLFSLFDEFCLDLAVLFDRHNIQGRLFPRESALLALLDQINHFEIDHLWAEDETIGWIYQYFNSQEERKKMRAESLAPRNSRELAVRNQFFTPRYVVEFLTDNTLGRIWYEMTQGKTSLVTSCRYLVRRPTEIFLAKGEATQEVVTEEQDSLSQEELQKQPVYIPFRALKDPRELRMLDPACGSMHFGLYAFDLFEKIYEEAWQLETELGPDVFERSKEMGPLHTTFTSFEEFRKAIPKLIIEQNIHGVDIDPRAVQIAGLSLWQRAQRSWHLMGIKPKNRPVIKKSNIVCAEPMPGEKEMLREFTAKLNPPVLGQLVETIFDKMKLAGEVGTLLKIEEEISSVILLAKEEYNNELLRQKREAGYLPGMAPPKPNTLFDFTDLKDDTAFWETAEERILEALSEYADQAESDGGQKRLFAEDAAKGFAFIDLCRKRFDLVLMNPPFGEPTDLSLKWLNQEYKTAIRNLYIAFVERGRHISLPDGFVGAITDATFIHQNRYEKFRSSIVTTDEQRLTHLTANGWGVLDAYVETACSIIGKGNENYVFMVDLKESNEKQSTLYQAVVNSNKHSEDQTDDYFYPVEAFRNLPKNSLAFWLPKELLKLFAQQKPLDPTSLDARCGMSSSDNGRFYKLWWEVATDEIGQDKKWSFLSNGGNPAPFLRKQTYVVNFRDKGIETKVRVAELYGSASRTIINESYYRKSGFTYGKRTESISFQLLPEGSIFSNEGQAIFPNSTVRIENLLAYLNTSLIAYILNSMAGQHKEAGYVGAMPTAPAKFFEDIEVADRVKKALYILHDCYSRVPEYQYFTSVLLDLKYNLISLKEMEKEFLRASNDFKELMLENDILLNKLVGKENGQFEEFENREWSLSKIIYNNDISSIRKIFCFDIIGYLVGCIFGRWDYKKASYPIPKSDILSLLKPIPATPVALNCDEGRYDIIESDYHGDCRLTIEIESLLKNLGDIQSTMLSEILAELHVEELKTIFTNSNLFFDSHLSRYSISRRQAPIYWPLQTPSDSYTLWVYYHRLTEQTLYTCVNDFVEPKLKTVLDDLNGLHDKSSRSSAEEKELAKLTDLETELKDFRDELLLIAKFWKPNLNDGVQITAAPLWKLFQHKPWRKKMKETWESLEKGEYDWAHLACNIWPKRVLRKCYEDRSLAIAHDVENDFWEEVEVPTKKGEPKTEWKPKELSENQLNELIRQKMTEAK